MRCHEAIFAHLGFLRTQEAGRNFQTRPHHSGVADTKREQLEVSCSLGDLRLA
jgi:hypothetical protein